LEKRRQEDLVLVVQAPDRQMHPTTTHTCMISGAAILCNFDSRSACVTGLKHTIPGMSLIHTMQSKGLYLCLVE
jgi:hypothetical protein